MRTQKIQHEKGNSKVKKNAHKNKHTNEHKNIHITKKKQQKIKTKK